MRTFAHILHSATEQIYQRMENDNHHSLRAVIDSCAHGVQLLAAEVSRMTQRATGGDHCRRGASRRGAQKVSANWGCRP
jgi:hypothetical protein